MIILPQGSYRLVPCPSKPDTRLIVNLARLLYRSSLNKAQYERFIISHGFLEILRTGSVQLPSFTKLV